jgi:antitoxin ParD1/3/4
MEVSLKPELEKFLREKIESGKYQSFDEAINKRVELIKNQEDIYQGRFEELKREIMKGVEAAEKGKFVDSEIVFYKLQQKLKTKS